MENKTEDFEKSHKEIKDLYEDVLSIAEANPQLYIMPLELYNRIVKKLSHIEDRIKSQTESLRLHLREKQELRRRLKNDK